MTEVLTPLQTLRKIYIYKHSTIITITTLHHQLAWSICDGTQQKSFRNFNGLDFTKLAKVKTFPSISFTAHRFHWKEFWKVTKVLNFVQVYNRYKRLSYNYMIISVFRIMPINFDSTGKTYVTSYVWLLSLLCPTLRLDVMSHAVDCIFQMSNHTICVFCRDSIYHTRV